MKNAENQKYALISTAPSPTFIHFTVRPFANWHRQFAVRCGSVSQFVYRVRIPKIYELMP